MQERAYGKKFIDSGRKNGDNYLLSIPNKEVRQIFVQQVKEWFSEISAQDMSGIHAFTNAFKKGDVATIEEMFTSYLKKTISTRDTVAQSEVLLGRYSDNRQLSWKSKNTKRIICGYG